MDIHELLSTQFVDKLVNLILSKEYTFDKNKQTIEQKFNNTIRDPREHCEELDYNEIWNCCMDGILHQLTEAAKDLQPYAISLEECTGQAFL